ncbi:hypothetical protein KSP40_PGU003046 [Platanthera guangdongensis]|uniref:Uncharacterized protein n=1 Tax=Platanthera guangdongensis TaxID=2320717 RepID=A0ABR2LKM0_9ASPA
MAMFWGLAFGPRHSIRQICQKSRIHIPHLDSFAESPLDFLGYEEHWACPYHGRGVVGGWSYKLAGKD